MTCENGAYKWKFGQYTDVLDFSLVLINTVYSPTLVIYSPKLAINLNGTNLIVNLAKARTLSLTTIREIFEDRRSLVNKGLMGSNASSPRVVIFLLRMELAVIEGGT